MQVNVTAVRSVCIVAAMVFSHPQDFVRLVIIVCSNRLLLLQFQPRLEVGVQRVIFVDEELGIHRNVRLVHSVMLKG